MAPQQIPALDMRLAAHPVDQRFVQRWSPRSFAADPVPRSHIEIMLEAARWAPSSMNEQPWRYTITTDGPLRARLNDAIMDGNRWADAAPLIIWVSARRTFARNGQPNRHAWFDAGAATMQLVLQAEQMGYSAHHMGGIHAHRAAEILGLEDEDIICAIAIGKRGPASALPEALRAREGPSQRAPQEAFVRWE